MEESASTHQRGSQQPNHQRRRLSNRVAYLGLLSFLGPFLNFAYNWKETKDMGITLSLVLWIFFGGFWCAGFSSLMGPIFAAGSVVIRFLDVVPALGSSLWVCLSTFVMAAVINDPFPAFLHNLPLFSVIFANGLIFRSELSQDDGFWRLASAMNTAENAIRASDYTGFSEPVYYWQDGRLCFGFYNRSRESSSQSLYEIKRLSVPEGASQSLQDLQDNGHSYVSGEQLEQFAQYFQIWKAHTQRIASTMAFRRAFCLIGFLVEATAVVSTIAILGGLSASGSGSSFLGSHGNVGETANNPAPSQEVVSSTATLSMRSSLIISPLDFSILQIFVCVALILFSDYLQTVINVGRSFTTVTEVRAFMVRCLEYRFIDWSGPHSGYLANGRRLRATRELFENEEMPLNELPTLGIVGDPAESELLDNVVLRSTIPSKFLTLVRIKESVVASRLYDPGSDRGVLLNGERERK